MFYAPVEDFELSVTDPAGHGWVDLPGRGPRIVLVLGGAGQVATDDDPPVEAGSGNAFFVPAGTGAVRARGAAQIIQAAVP